MIKATPSRNISVENDRKLTFAVRHLERLYLHYQSERVDIRANFFQLIALSNEYCERTYYMNNHFWSSPSAAEH